MEIKRERYLNQLIERRGNGSVKVITGIRRCGKSYLLNKLYAGYLLQSDVIPDHIIKVALDSDENELLLERKILGDYLRNKLTDDGDYCALLDEIQLAEHFEKLLNGLGQNYNLDIYVTGSHSKFLSSDIVTEFRGRGDEIRVRQLTFAEYLPAYIGTQQQAWVDYFTYGGCLLSCPKRAMKRKYSIWNPSSTPYASMTLSNAKGSATNQH